MRAFEAVECFARKNHEDEFDIMLPTRSSVGSAGYDFYATEDMEIQPNEVHVMWTDVKARMDDNDVLLLFPRSSVGIKQHVMLANTCGVVDASYYGNADNDGNIGIALYNYSLMEPVKIRKGARIAQGVFVKYQTTGDDDTTDERSGGFGSSGI